MIILCLALLFSPALRAGESFEDGVESSVRAMVPPAISSSTAFDPGPVSLRLSLERRDGRYDEIATMTMTRRTFDRYRERQRRWEDDEPLRRGFDEDPRRYYGSFGGRDAAAIADVLITGLSLDPYVRSHPWLDEPVSFLVGAMAVFERFDRGSVFDVLGFEVDDFVGDHFGLGSGRAARGLAGPIKGSPDGEFHGRLRIGVSGLERAAMGFEADPLKLKAKYEIRCPRSFILDRLEIGGEVRPFCRDERDSFRVFIRGGKSF